MSCGNLDNSPEEGYCFSFCSSIFSTRSHCKRLVHPHLRHLSLPIVCWCPVENHKHILFLGCFQSSTYRLCWLKLATWNQTHSQWWTHQVSCRDLPSPPLMDLCWRSQFAMFWNLHGVKNWWVVGKRVSKPRRIKMTTTMQHYFLSAQHRTYLRL